MSLAKTELDATAPDFKVLVADDSPIYRKLVEHALAEKQSYSSLIGLGKCCRQSGGYRETSEASD
jgi:CheY-like chemotaxis protein